MANITISLPASQTGLRRDIEQALKPIATVRSGPPRAGGSISFRGAPEVSQLVEVIAALTAAAGALGAISDAGDKLLDLIERIRQQRRPSGISITGRDGERRSIEEVDEVWLRTQLGDPYASFRAKRWR